jgi:septal ring factor EnvC (AmiA/AmiB activator)
MTSKVELITYGSSGLLVGVATWGASIYSTRLFPILATIDQNQIIALGALMTVLATGLTGILGAVSKALLAAVRDYRDMTSASIAGKLDACECARKEAEEHLREVRSAYSSMKDLAEQRQNEIMTLRAERNELRIDLEKMRQSYRILAEQVAKNNQTLTERVSKSGDDIPVVKDVVRDV